MIFKQMVLFLVLAALLLAGCGRGSEHLPLPESRQLGKEYAVYDPPPGKTDETGAGGEFGYEDELTLRQALSRALMNNPGLRIRSLKVRAAEAARLGAGLRPDPELEFEAEEFGGPGELREFDNAEYSILLSQLIELGGKRGKRGKLAQLEMESAGWEYEAARLDLFSDVTEAFHGVLAAQRRVEIVTGLLRSSEETLLSVRRRVEAGKDSPLEATKAQVAHSGMIVQHERAKGDLEVARARLAATWGDAEAGFGRAAGDLERISPVPGFGDLLALLGDNPEIVRSIIDRDSKDAALALEKATAVPDLTIRGGMKRFAGSGDNSLILGLSIPIPLFDRNRGGRLMAYHEVAAADENLKAVSLSVRTRLVEAYSRLSSAYTEADQIDSSIMESAEDLYRASRMSYDEGKVDYLMLLDAQRTLFELKTHYIDILVSYHSARVEVEKLIGRSIENVGMEEREGTR